MRAKIHPDLPHYTFMLRGEAEEPGETLRAEAIEIRREGAAEPVQVIADLEAETPAEGPGVEVLDMNFDGYDDIRIVGSLPAGPNVGYLNWLFEPESGQFVRSPALDDIIAPEFDSEAGVIRSEWRDGAATYGADTYRVVDGAPVLVRKELKEYSAEGTYRLTVSERVDGEWQVVEDRMVEEAGG